jgi:ubiquinone biosynthesis protein
VGAGSFARLVVAGAVLAHYDALTPREFAHLLPPPARLAGGIARTLAGGWARRGRPGQRLGEAFERLGPVAIKLGQLLSTRADIFGAEFAEDLSRLKDRLPPFPRARAVETVEANLDRPVASLYAEFGEAVAAASIAQAHAAQLKDGRRVAVKVLRPGVEARVAADVRAMKLGAGLAERLAPPLRRLEPAAFVATVARSLELELDLRLEAAAASELGEVMARDGYMSAPAVVWDGVGRQVLTLEWVQGAPLSAGSTLELEGLDRPTLANNLIRAFLAQALDHGVFHADLHEGNLFVTAPASIAAVDFGIVGRLGPKEQRFLAEILWGFLRRDYRRVAEVHLDAGYVPARHSIDDFAQALRAVGEPIFGRPAREVSMGRLLGQLFEITALFDMHLRPELVLLQKTMASVEGVARRIDPDHDIWEAARPVVERWIARELSPAARARRLVEQGVKAVEGLAAWAEAAGAPAAPVAVTVKSSRAGPIALALALLALAAAGAALWVSVAPG